MAGKRDEPVARPLKRAEYEIRFLTRDAAKGWNDCLAVARNATVTAWERLTTAPTHEDDRLYQLKADYATREHEGRTYARYQYKITSGGRLWYIIRPAAKGAKVAGYVLLERCEPGHPAETDR